MAETKVYCINCLYYFPGERIPFSYGPPEHQKEICNSPNNLKDTYAEPSSLLKSQPKVINRFNDCIWYTPILTSSSSSAGISSSSSSIILDMP